jgi:hypothetical protein
MILVSPLATSIAKVVSETRTVNLARLVGQCAVNAGPSPLPSIEDGEAVEVHAP